jgi:hypothetical protein
MRRTVQPIFILALICGSSVSGIAQLKKPAQPPRAADPSLQRSEEFISREGRFSVLFPGTPKESAPDDNYSPDRYPMYYVTYKSAASYMVMYIDYPEMIDSSALAKAYMDRARDAGLSAADRAGDHPQLVKEMDIAFEGHRGRFFQINLASNKILRGNFIVVRNRFYYIEVITPTGQSKARGAKTDYERMAMRFLNSFHLTQ